MDVLWTGLAGIFVLAFGNGMLGASTRRSIAVQAGRKHSQTGELLVEMPGHYRVRGWVLVGAGLGLLAVALGCYMLAVPVPLLG